MNVNITSAQYVNGRDGNNSSVIATIDGVSLEVPLDPDNRHWKALQEWLAEGNTIAEAD